MANKLGFLKGKDLAPTSLAPLSPDATSSPAPRKPLLVEQAFPPSFTLPMHVLSQNPRIIRPGFRVENPPCFLYLPGTTGEHSTVVIDFENELRQMAQWSAWAESAPVGTADVRVVEMPGKGVGIVAARSFKSGEVVVSERPTLCARMALFVEKEGRLTYAPNEFYCRALRDLCDTARNAFFALKNILPSQGSAVGVISTNALHLDIGEEFLPKINYPHWAVYPTLSRANHSCTPTTHYQFVYPIEGQLLAARDIAAGEEITQGYIATNATHASRQADLTRRYQFTCTCDACSLSPVSLKKSDIRRTLLSRLIFNAKYNANVPIRAPLKVFEDGLAWAEEEGLPFQYAMVAALGAKMANTNYDAKTGKVWTERAFRAWSVIKGAQWSATALEVSDALYKFLGV